MWWQPRPGILCLSSARQKMRTERRGISLHLAAVSTTTHREAGRLGLFGLCVYSAPSERWLSGRKRRFAKPFMALRDYCANLNDNRMNTALNHVIRGLVSLSKKRTFTQSGCCMLLHVVACHRHPVEQVGVTLPPGTGQERRTLTWERRSPSGWASGAARACRKSFLGQMRGKLLEVTRPSLRPACPDSPPTA
jgi:hypothetical protein